MLRLRLGAYLQREVKCDESGLRGRRVRGWCVMLSVGGVGGGGGGGVVYREQSPTGVKTQPDAELHESRVQGSPSLQITGKFTQP